MNLKFFCPYWGSEQMPWNDLLQKIKEAGYDGMEYGIAPDTSEKELTNVWNLALKNNLEIIPQYYGSFSANFKEHYEAFEAWFEKIAPFPALKIDSQTGRDFFSFEENKKLIDFTENYSKRTGVPVLHETHRNKMAFAAHITKDYLERIPYFNITLDLSHWVNVAESYLQDQQDAMELAVSRTDHIHARVGYPEGPQVPNPMAPEWKEAVDHHLIWWDKVVAIKKAADKTITITPEFGPYPYMVHQPYTLEPIANQWEINVYMMNMLKERYLH